MKARYSYVFTLTNGDQTDFVVARSKFKVVDIVRLGIKEALKQCPTPSERVIKKAMELHDKLYPKK